MATDLIRYDVLVQQALRSVVRKVLADGARDGLPGTHHFYISFDTNAPGVKITPRLHGMYPEEMTIVLQHQFWELVVHDTGFEVSLSFDKIPERLIVPFDAVTGFFDPSVKFGLKFEAVTAETEETGPAPRSRKPRAVKTDEPSEPVQIGRKPKSVKETAGKEPAREMAKDASAKDAAARDAVAKDTVAKDATKESATKEPAGKNDRPADGEGAAAADGDAASGQVVSLDAFRKKK